MRKIFFMPKATLCAAALLFQACASKPNNHQAFAPTADPSTEISNLRSSLDQARQEEVHLLAPQAFSRAQKEYASAVDARSKNKDNTQVLDRVARGNAHLATARNLATVARNSFENVLKAREAAVTAGAHESQKEEFQKGERALHEASKEMEEGDLKVDAKVVSRLEKPFRDAELAAIKETYIGVARKHIEAAKKEGAEKITPSVFKSALDKYYEAQTAIEKDRYAVDQFKPLTDVANSEAALVLKITRDAKIAAKKSPEELAVEAHQAESKIADLSTTLESDKARLQTLESEEQVEQKIAALRQRFSPEEADVFREGDRVLIRLKNVRFPVNRANIGPQQIPALAKVQDAVKMFGDKKITVEGHTDSTGGKSLNQQLSEKRAALVESYLVANGAVSEDQIDSVGYGFQKPLTSNKTAQGRAQNRRIDVVIEL